MLSIGILVFAFVLMAVEVYTILKITTNIKEAH